MKSNWSQYTGLNLKVGFVISLGVSLLAFEWKSDEPISIVDFGGLGLTYDSEPIPPVTEMKPPAVAPKLLPEIVEVENTAVINNTEEVIFSVEPTENVPTIDEPVEPDGEPEEVIDNAPFTIVEESALPEGGMQGFYDYVRKNLEYPRQAKRMGVQGKVFLEFIVERDGTLSDIKVLRGIGAGCDEEAARILKESPKWKPAKQRGKGVRQKMTFPIAFKLQ